MFPNLFIILLIYGIIVFFVCYYCYKYRKVRNVQFANTLLSASRNPQNHLKKQISNSQKNILIVQTGAYCKKSGLPSFVQHSIITNKTYCKKWGYDYMNVLLPKCNKYSPYWIKVLTLNNIINEPKNRGKYKYILYLDYDAIFTNFDISLEFLLSDMKKQEKSITSCSIFVGKNPNVFDLGNAGVILFRIDSKTRAFIKQWMDGFERVKKNWKYQHKSWRCTYSSTNVPCLWGMNKYEQGVFNTLIQKKEFEKYVCVLEFDYFSRKHMNSNSFIIHFMGRSKKELEDFQIPTE